MLVAAVSLLHSVGYALVSVAPDALIVKRNCDDHDVIESVELCAFPAIQCTTTTATPATASAGATAATVISHRQGPVDLMSPEAFAGGAMSAEKNDVWALAACLVSHTLGGALSRGCGDC